MSSNYNWHYEYDGLSRLVSVCLGDSFEYTYDGAGDLLSFSRWSGSAVETVNCFYNAANKIAASMGTEMEPVEILAMSPTVMMPMVT
jgi:hypothetical protein